MLSIVVRARLSLSLLATLCAACACASHPDPQAKKTAAPPYTVMVALDRSVSIADESLTVALTDIKDSRCPVEVDCIWAGHAEVTLSVRLHDAPAVPVVIGTVAPEGMKLPGEAVHAGYRFKLLKLEPDNSNDQPATMAQYRATVQISK